MYRFALLLLSAAVFSPAQAFEVRLENPELRVEDPFAFPPADDESTVDGDTYVLQTICHDGAKSYSDQTDNYDDAVDCCYEAGCGVGPGTTYTNGDGDSCFTEECQCGFDELTGFDYIFGTASSQDDRDYLSCLLGE